MCTSTASFPTACSCARTATCASSRWHRLPTRTCWRCSAGWSCVSSGCCARGLRQRSSTRGTSAALPVFSEAEGERHMRRFSSALVTALKSSQVVYVGVLGFFLLSRRGNASGQTWTNNGPEGGVVYSIAIDPSNASIVYAGTRAGIFKSTDGAGSWSLAIAGLEGSSGYALAIDAVTPNVLYAATFNRGVYKTVDGGASWSPINDGLIPYVISLGIDPTAPTTLYAVGSIPSEMT